MLFGPCPLSQGQTINTATITIPSLLNRVPDLVWWTGFPPNPSPPPPDGTYGARGAINGYDSDNGDPITPDNDAAARTTASFTYVRTGVLSGSGTVYTPQLSAGQSDSYDVTAIVQEIVNRAGWSSGNNIRFFFDESGSDSSFPGSPNYGCWVSYGNISPTLDVT
jgi:hypothetical protein